MIRQGDMTIIGTTTYRCLKIEDGMAHLKNILHEQGRPKIIEQKYCPFLLDGQIVTPEKPKLVLKPRVTKINVTQLIKENTDLTISNDAKYFISEWVETAISNLINNAEQNALIRGDSRITPAHFFWLETNTAPNGYWPKNKEHISESE